MFRGSMYIQVFVYIYTHLDAYLGPEGAGVFVCVFVCLQ